MKRKEHLPSDIIYQILIKLPTRSIQRFRCVSKQFQDIIMDASFIPSHVRQKITSVIIHAQPRYSLIHHIDLYLIIGDGVRGGVARMKVPQPCKSSLSLISSCDGLLCFLEPVRSGYFICNPLKQEWITVPRSRNSGFSYVTGFYLHPPSGEYRLLSMTSGRLFEVHSLGEESWRRIGNEPYNLPASSVSIPISVHGRLHWVGSTYNPLSKAETDGIITFDMDKEKFKQMSHPRGMHISSQNRLIMLEGCLGLCQVTHLKMDIWMLRDYKGEIWRKLYTVPIQSIPCPPGGSTNILLRPLAARTDEELWLRWHSRGMNYSPLILYNLRLNTFKAIDVDRSIPWSNYTASYAPYVESLTSPKSFDKKEICTKRDEEKTVFAT